jgi:transposase-like protein
MPRPGPRTIARYSEQFKATAVRLSQLPGVQVGLPPIFRTPRLGGMMISEVSDGKTELHGGVQARGGQASP